MSFANLLYPIETIVHRAIAVGDFPGCVVGVVDSSGERLVLPFGAQRFESDAPPVVANTIYDAASITKSIPVSSLALQAIDECLLTHDTLLADIVPEYRSPYRNVVRIRHLLTHVLDFDFRLSSLKNQSPESILDTILSSNLKCPPGDSYFYSNATSILLGMAVERVFGKELSILARERFFDPLDMGDTGFRPTPDLLPRIAPTEIDAWRGGAVHGEVHDESAWVLGRIMTPGSAGLFTTVPDLLQFLSMLLNGGVSGERRYFSEKIMADLHTNALAGTPFVAAPGWERAQSRYMGEKASIRTIGKTGFTGCVVMADPDCGRALAFLTNYTWPHRKDGPERINAVRRSLADAVFGDLL